MEVKSVQIQMDLVHKKEINVEQDTVILEKVAVQEIYVVWEVYALILVEVVEILVEVVVEKPQVAAQTLVQEDGWDTMDANILNEAATIHKALLGLGQSVRAHLDKSVLKGIAGTLMKKIVYIPEVLHGMTINSVVYVQVR